MVARGIVQVPEGRRLFPFMTVHENLLLGAHARARPAPSRRPRCDYVLAALPGAGGARHASSRARSRAASSRCARSAGPSWRGPRLLMLDEPTLGIAPVLVQRIFETVAAINRDGVTILLVEQNVRRALALAHRAVALENGRVVLSGPAPRAPGRRPAQEGLSRHVRREPMRINRARLAESMEALGKIGETPRGGLHRVALTDDDRRGRDLLVRWMKEAGLAVTVDQMGNIFGLRAGTEARPPGVHGLARRTRCRAAASTTASSACSARSRRSGA